MPLVRKNFYFSSEQLEYLEIFDRISVSEHIRRAIDEYIDKLKMLYVSTSQSKRKEE